MPTAPVQSGGGNAGYKVPTSGPVTPREVYTLLINKGFSTVQAIGIMANAINESGLNPEAVGDGGTSFGFVQFHEPGYAGASSLVTGNPQKDIRDQVNYLAQVIPKNAIAGSTPSAVAGNVAANFERCVGCQPGGAQYNSRVGNAATVAKWVGSGQWPASNVSTVGGTGGGGSGSSSSGAATGTQSACLVSAPSLSLPIVGTVAGGGCLFTKSNARAFLATGMLIAGGGILALGALILAAYGLKAAGAGKVAGRALEVGGAVAAVAGAPELGVPLAAAGSRVRSQGPSRAATGMATERGKRQLGQQKQATSEQAAQERHTAAQYRRQPAARRNFQRDEDRQPVPF